MEVKDLQREAMFMEMIKERTEILVQQAQYIQKLEQELSDTKKVPEAEVKTDETYGGKE